MNFEQQRAESKLKERHEWVMLAIVSFFLLIWWWSAGFANTEKTPEALRYSYDASAKFLTQSGSSFRPQGSLRANGTVSNGYLSELCGATWYDNFYSAKNRSQRVALLEQCELTPEQHAQAIKTVQKNINGLHADIFKQYQYYKSPEYQTNQSGENASLTSGQPVKEKDYFIQYLKLNEHGRSNLLDEVSKLLDEVDNTNKAIILAFLAASEGDTAFPYRQLFIEQQKQAQNNGQKENFALVASQLNQTANYVRKNIRINTEWADKAVKAQRIISFFGFLTFLTMAWMSYGLLILARRLTKPVTLLGIALVIWSIFGLVVMPKFTYLNYKILYVMCTVGVILPFILGKKLLVHTVSVRNTVATRMGYPLFVLFLGIGFGILLDLSVRAHLENRFLILNQFGAYYWAFVVLSIAPTVGFIFSKFFSKIFSRLMLAVFWAKNKTEQIVAYSIVGIACIGIWACSFVLSTNNVIEILKLWLIFGLGLFLTVSRFSLGSKKLSHTNLFALGVILFVPVVGMGIMTEMGTLLVISYAMIIMLASYFNYASGLSGKGKNWGVFAQNNLVSIVWTTLLIIALTALVVNIAPVFHDRTAERVDSWLNPFLSVNDQLAIIHWLRHSTPALGYSLGEIPWCGFMDSRCYVPKQMQSDYTPTSVMLLFGVKPALILFGFYAWWLLHFVKGHLKANTGIINSQHNLVQVFLVWSGMIWVVITFCQMMVTLAGNLGALPLTGITLPFISYGMSSLVLSSFFIGLLINRPFVIEQRKAGAV